MMTLDEIARYLVDVKFKLNVINENTYIRYLSTLNIISGFSFDYTKYDSLVDFFAFVVRKYSQSSVHKIYNLLRMSYDYAFANDLIDSNFMISFREPRSLIKTKDVSSLNMYEHKLLVNVLSKFEVNNIFSDICLLQINSGMRLGEILALDKSDIFNDYIRINKSLTKNIHNVEIVGNTAKTYNSCRNISKTVVLDSILKHVLLHAPPNVPYLFFNNKTNNIITVSSVNSFLGRLNRKYHICSNLTSHVLRHTYATRCIESGMPAVVLAKKLGHKDVKITLNIYSTVFEQFVDNKDVDFVRYLYRGGLLGDSVF